MWLLERLSELMGGYFYQFMVQTISLSQFVLAGGIFALSLRRRKRFAARVLLGVAFFFAIVMLVAVIRTNRDTAVSQIIAGFLKYAAPLPLLFLCFEEDWGSIILCWCAGIAAENAGGRFVSLVLSVLGVDDIQSIFLLGALPSHDLFWDYLVYYAMHLAVYLALYFLFGRRELPETDWRDRVTIVILALTSAAFLNLMRIYTSLYRPESAALYAATQIYSIAASLFTLSLRAGILFRGRYREEVGIMEQVIQEERKQYQSMKKNMDIINLKCHDLKHQLSHLAGRLTDREVRELQDAIKIYDNSIKTGCEVLDVLLYELQLVSDKENIHVSCIADGTCLEFVRTRHLYSLLNNALSNALEAVRQVKEDDKRVIGISVARDKGLAVISVSNYFTGRRQLTEGETTKDDRDHHGFGMMSMRYVAEQYKGRVETTIAGDMFVLQISVPIPAGLGGEVL